MVAQIKGVEKPKESPADMLFRLYRKGLEEGVTILTESADERKFATSGTMPGIVYAVSEQGCSCAGYTAFKRCKHFAMFLQEAGLRPPTEAEIAAAAAEFARLADLQKRNQIKSTGDWRGYLTAKRAYEHAMSFVGVAGMQPSPAA
jgi:hypothetical protein